MALQVPNTQVPTPGAIKVRTNLYLANIESDFYGIPAPVTVNDRSGESDESGSATPTNEALDELQSNLNAAVQGDTRMARHHRADQHRIQLWQKMLGMRTLNHRLSCHANYPAYQKSLQEQIDTLKTEREAAVVKNESITNTNEQLLVRIQEATTINDNRQVTIERLEKRGGRNNGSSKETALNNELIDMRAKRCTRRGY
jgi:hypothetical protein